MFFNQFEIIPIIAETKSFSKAAKLLHLSQPAISSKIQSMEDFYGIKLFNRTAQGVSLTEAGKIVNAYAVRFADLHRAMDGDLDKLLTINNPSISIGSSCTVGNYAMPSNIRAFKEKYPEVSIKLDIANTPSIIEKIMHKEVDVAVVEGDIANPHLTVKQLDKTQEILVCAQTDKCIKRDPISLKDLRAKPFVMREPGAAIRQTFEKAIASFGYAINEFNIVSEMGSIHSVKSAVMGGLGVALVPEIAVISELKFGLLRKIGIKELDIEMPINLAYLSTEELSSTTQKFIRYMTHPDKGGLNWTLNQA